jgi:hypothetical protein
MFMHYRSHASVPVFLFLVLSPAGDAISLIDPLFRAPSGRTGLPKLSGHSGGIIDMDVSGDLLVTCGMITRRDGSTLNDMFMKVRVGCMVYI